MFVTSHVAAGAVIGRVLAGHPAGAFAVGVASHFAMDACPHWGAVDDAEHYEQFLRVARCDGCSGLAAMALAAGLSSRRARRSVVAGMLGAALPDADKPMQYFFGWNPFPEPVQRFHKRVQNQAEHRLPAEILVGAALVALAVTAVRR